MRPAAAQQEGFDLIELIHPYLLPLPGPADHARVRLAGSAEAALVETKVGTSLIERGLCSMRRDAAGPTPPALTRIGAAAGSSNRPRLT